MTKHEKKQKDLSDQHHLGFLRVIEVFMVLNVICTIAFLSFTITSSVEIEFGTVLDLINLVFDAITFWLIWKRKKITKWCVIGFCLFNITIGTAYNIGAGEFSLFDQIVLSSNDILLLLYFIFSKRVPLVLNKSFDETTHYDDVDEESELYRPKTWRFWRNLIIYFCVFSVVGHWMEAGYCLFIKWGILPGTYDPNSGIWHDWLFPFCVYGVGAVACVLIFFPIKMWLQKKFKHVFIPLIISFLVNMCVCLAIEFTMGMMLNQHYELWDYRNMFCNFMGQICLQNGIGFGLVATLMTWVVYPLMERGIGRISTDGQRILFIGVVTGFLVLFFLYCINWDGPHDFIMQFAQEEAQEVLNDPNASSEDIQDAQKILDSAGDIKSTERS